MNSKEVGKKIDNIEKMVHCIDKNLAVTKSNVQRINGSVANNQKKVNELEKQITGLTVKIATFASFTAFIFAISGKWIWEKVMG